MAVFDCDGDGRPDLYLAGGGEPGRPVPQRQPDRRRAAVRARSPRPEDGPRRASPAPTRSMSTATGSPTSRSCATRRRRPAARASATAGSSRRTRPWALAADAGQHDGVQRDLGGCGDAADARVRQLRRASTATDGRLSTARTTSSSGLTHPARGYAPPTPLAPGFCPLSMLFSDWDGSGRRDLRVSNDRQYYDDEVGGEQLWRFEPGVAAAAYTAADGWAPGPALGDGHRQPGPDRRRLPRGLPHEPGRQQAPDPGRRAVASPPTSDMASSTGVDAPPARSSAAIRCRRRPGIRSSRT